MKAVSDLLGIHWYLGMPMNQTTPARLEIVETAEPILGEYLLRCVDSYCNILCICSHCPSWHLGNEPDLYEKHEKRPAGYDEAAYIEVRLSLNLFIDQILTRCSLL